ncbi:uncharacterized protein STEHIDRAFT_163785 [Stereum hirsutum FP-91666 SS1]|uniref:Conserved oligomeric Golgi complex subunit 8 n=1 Tax=Stereum hirsutum (strain FP-91666) TaxID=721885 RepID=R7RW07_STEHR|nr:uncharacterized protein STEHIDRAFT_163785 [Stereum hirsutum FP-91666 SS1]EIM79434.1 hypothetical protein STEHIDRAFT_163785 [Stereum hirsutum FP-91666 SS1]
MVRPAAVHFFCFLPSSRALPPLAFDLKDASSPLPPSCHDLTFRYAKKADLFLSLLPSLFLPLSTGSKLVRESRPVSPVLHPTRPSTTATILAAPLCTHNHIYRQRFTSPIATSANGARTPSPEPAHPPTSPGGLHSLAEESENESVAPPKVSVSSDGTDEGAVMRETMTDVQQAIGQLGQRRNNGAGGHTDDEGRSFTFSSVRESESTDRESDIDMELEREGNEGTDGEGWNNQKNVRKRLAKKVSRANEEERREREAQLEVVRARERGSIMASHMAPPIEVELSDESEDEGDDDHHHHHHGHDQEDKTEHGRVASQRSSSQMIPEEDENDHLLAVPTATRGSFGTPRGPEPIVSSEDYIVPSPGSHKTGYEEVPTATQASFPVAAPASERTSSPYRSGTLPSPISPGFTTGTTGTTTGTGTVTDDSRPTSISLVHLPQLTDARLLLYLPLNIVRHAPPCLVIDQSTKLNGILELPFLIETCIWNGFYAEALDLHSHAAALAAKFPDARVVGDVMAEVDGAIRGLVQGLVGVLREQGVKLPALWNARVLRRMGVYGVEDEGEESAVPSSSSPSFRPSRPTPSKPASTPPSKPFFPTYKTPRRLYPSSPNSPTAPPPSPASASISEACWARDSRISSGEHRVRHRERDEEFRRACAEGDTVGNEHETEEIAERVVGFD